MSISPAEVPSIRKGIAVVVVIVGVVLLGLALGAGITIGLIIEGR